jgi:hypothetical protein
MAVAEGDFEKGEADGAHTSLRVIASVVRAWRAMDTPPKEGRRGLTGN